NQNFDDPTRHTFSIPKNLSEKFDLRIRETTFDSPETCSLKRDYRIIEAANVSDGSPEPKE
ncbi:hypothetical protein, partial [Chitinophaga sp.]|uniref:hypothetical protein n=1 Tax=Chitinophaga sp. TaxID=1869181 RepID=UPI00263A2F17